jgi:hypothetical protein
MPLAPVALPVAVMAVRMPSPVMPGLHCSVYAPAGSSTVSSAEVPGPTFSRSPTIVPFGRST